MDVGAWLLELGLQKYTAAFRENGVDGAVLPTLTADDLRDLGVTLVGDRRRLLNAIAVLRDTALVQTPTIEVIAAQTVTPPAERVGEAGVAHRAGERRHLTVLFSDIVGSTRIAAALDAEEWRDIVAEYHRTVAAAVHRFGGFVAQKMGDGAMAYFGYPQAQENDAERAVRAGLAVLDAVARQSAALTARGGPKLEVRVGIHAGSVVITEEALVFGEVPNIAARVQTSAESGTLVITRDVHRLVSGLFVAVERGAHALKGVAEPVELFQVTRASGAGRPRAAGRAPTPLIGREEELHQIESRWQRVLAGQGQMVMLVGEPGLGKSRLTEEFHNRLADVPHTWVEFACSQLLQNTPFHPFIVFAKRRLEEQEPTADGRVAALAAWHGAVGLEPRQSVPLVAQLLELPVPADYPPPPAAPEERRRRLIATLAAWITGGARAQTISLLVEDVHWADPSTIDLLRVLAEQGASVPLMVLMTTRLEFRAPWPHRSHHTVLTLAPLDRADVRRMVAEVASRHAVSGETMEALVARTGGVPLFVEEVTRLVLESGKQGGVHQIPFTLQASLMARLDRLGPAKEVAQIAAVLGREFFYPLIRAVAGLSDAILTAALDRLIEANLVHAQGLPPDATYRFKHALVQDAAYESLLKTRRRDLHRTAARALTDQFKEIADTQPELLAYHLTEAGENQAAAAAWQLAGDSALKRAAYAESIAHFSKAITLADQSAERYGSEPGGRLRRVKLRNSLGQAMIAARGHGAPETTAVFADTRELAAGIEDTIERFSTYYGIWAGALLRGEPSTLKEIADSCLRESGDRPNASEYSVARRIAGATCWWTGDYAAARGHLEQALRAYHAERDRPLAFRFGQDVGLSAMVYLAHTLWALGDVAPARGLIDQAVEHALQTDHVVSIAYALLFGSLFEFMASNPAKVPRHAIPLQDLAREHGLQLFSAYGTFMHGWMAWRDNPSQDGLVEMRAALDSVRAQGNYLFNPYFRIAQLDAEVTAGGVAAGLTLLDETLAENQGNGQRYLDAELHRLRGELLLQQDVANAGPAEAAFQTAIAIAQEQNARSFKLRAALALAKLFQATSRVADAHAVLTPALEGFAPTPEFPEIEQAQMLVAVMTDREDVTNVTAFRGNPG